MDRGVCGGHGQVQQLDLKGLYTAIRSGGSYTAIKVLSNDLYNEFAVAVMLRHFWFSLLGGMFWCSCATEKPTLMQQTTNGIPYHMSRIDMYDSTTLII
jgi:hypothetical protein